MSHTMSKGLVLATVLWATAGSLNSSAFAGDAISWRSAGLRAGVDDQFDDDDFRLLEAFATWSLPWSHQWQSGWSFDAYLEAGAGTLRNEGESGFIGSMGPGGAFTAPNGRVRLVLGVNPTYLDRYRFGDENLGGRFAFTTYFGAELRLGRHGLVGLRWQHTSNANIFHPNPGFNQIVVHAGYSF